MKRPPFMSPLYSLPRFYRGKGSTPTNVGGGVLTCPVQLGFLRDFIQESMLTGPEPK